MQKWLKNKDSGIIMPYNEYAAKLAYMEPHTIEPEVVAKPKASKSKKKSTSE